MEPLRAEMADRAELLEAAVDCVPEGVAILGDDNQVAFWNQAAQAITGYTPDELIGRTIPDGLKPLLEGRELQMGLDVWDGAGVRQGALIHAGHKMGHPVAAMARVLILRDGLGRRMGAAVLFHPTECLDALPRGISGDSEDVEASQVETAGSAGIAFRRLCPRRCGVWSSLGRRGSGKRSAQDARRRGLRSDVEEGREGADAGPAAGGTTGPLGRGRVSGHLA